MGFSLLGLTIIALAWAVQFLQTWSKGRSLSIAFVALYGAGVALLVISALPSFGTETWLNVLTLLLVVLVLVRTNR